MCFPLDFFSLDSKYICFWPNFHLECYSKTNARVVTSVNYPSKAMYWKSRANYITHYSLLSTLYTLIHIEHRAADKLAEDTVGRDVEAGDWRKIRQEVQQTVGLRASG